MKQAITFVDIKKLIQHERICRTHLIEVKKQILNSGVIRRPVVVDKKTNVILDGHHRVEALRTLGAIRVPVMYINYQDMCVRVYMRRKELLMKLIKHFVIEMALSRTLFPYKSTRHLIHNRPLMKAVYVSFLMKHI